MEKQIKFKESGKGTVLGEDIPTFRIALETAGDQKKKIRVQIREGAADGRGASDPQYANSPLYATCRDEVELGRILYDAIFVGAIRERFEAHRSSLGPVSPDSPVRLRLLLEIQASPIRSEPLFNLPWELLHDGQGFLALDYGVSIARCPIGAQVVEKPIQPPLRVLVASAEPQAEGLPRFDGDAYLQGISEALQGVKPLDLRQLPHATQANLKEALAKGVHIFHFLGHGDVKISDVEIDRGVVMGHLYLERPDDPLRADVLTSTTLQQWMSQCDLRPNLVVFTACRSSITEYAPALGVSQAMLYAGIPAVVGMQADLYLDEAQTFARSFYRMLADWAIVDKAILAARRSLAENQSVFLRGGTESVLQRMLDLEWLRICYTPHAEALARRAPVKGFTPFPAWAVPVLFLQGSGWLGREPPEREITWKKDGKTMVYVEEGRFYVDKYPVTCAEYQRFVNETGRMWHNPWAHMEGWEQLPATNVTLEDVLAYAEWAGKHLPTLDEWLQAALAGCPDKSQKYPWGHDFWADRCNSREMGLNHPWPVIESEAREGSNKAGVCDLVGNAAEWVRITEEEGMLCGGSFREPKERCTVQSRAAADYQYASEAVGFRCVASWAEIIAQETI